MVRCLPLRALALIALVGCSKGSASRASTAADVAGASATDVGRAASADAGAASNDTVGGGGTGDATTPCAPLEVLSGKTGPDGCTLVTLGTECFTNPLHAEYVPNNGDPLFQIHDQEDGFYFNVELYTVYGAGWTGQTGMFDLDCTKNGICVYLVPDDVNRYLATSGKITITSLSRAGGAIQLPVEVRLEGARFQPVPNTAATGCYHLVSATLKKGG